MKLFNRRVRLVIGANGEGLSVSGLDITFDVKKSLKPEPNVATIEVRNLTEDHRKSFETSETLGVELHAGYEGGMSLIYLGEMRAAVTSREGPDLVTTIHSGDKHAMFAGKHIRVPLGEQTNAKVALEQLVKAMKAAGVGEGAALYEVLAGELEQKVLFPSGGVLSGNASTLLSSLCRSVGIEWSVQNGKLQFLKLGETDEEAFELGPDTGLIGKVEISNKGYVKATSLLIPGVKCGTKVTFSTETALVGGYRIEKIRYHGATFSKEWYCSIEAKAY